LRQTVSAELRRRYGLEYDPATEILVIVGVSEGLDLALRALLDPGDEVLIADPCYVAYPPCVALAGGVAVTVPTDAANGFVPRGRDAESIITPRTRAMLLNYPANPTGVVPGRRALEELDDRRPAA
jgi:aminotransferase